MSTGTSHLSEDDLYRASSQFRFWSFAPEQLAARRHETHALAIQRARQYDPNGAEDSYLTAEEELKLVESYVDIIRKTTTHIRWPVNIKTTAIQYLKRFYLSNSCMTYPPKEIYKTVMFLASKTEAFHITLSKFCGQISAVREAVLAPEYKVMQALRFTLDVRQPFRGLKGTLMELLNMVDDNIQGLKALKEPGGGSAWRTPGDGRAVEKKHIVDRINQAYHVARNTLDTPASTTDVYFLYTPSQILLAALQLADEPLLHFYLDSKLPTDAQMRPRILSTIQECADMMGAFRPENIITKDVRIALEAKLEACRDPSTKDLIKSHAAMKRSGAEDGDSQDEAKKRKMEKHKNAREADDMFGPAIGKG
ncbi:uncharacterized protein RCC_07222 [Ramularia collo-cygni]|uniref:RNA polymerase II holoenzyme cyclin-like subunit n=1 Tax=Ramularia collo-cygni TaxID=112498 RepID=A0A2D3VHF3_9PEZI|nr:uncharacterized protein RCC_07222 [Ramularia collo-cygni]CZT21359.1 uncharacterized protein RCC_07222 [Ramularia collo-cygni]